MNGDRFAFADHVPPFLSQFQRLLNGNEAFLAYVYSRTDLESLVEPLLHALYDFVAKKSKMI